MVEPPTPDDYAHVVNALESCQGELKRTNLRLTRANQAVGKVLADRDREWLAALSGEVDTIRTRILVRMGLR